MTVANPLNQAGLEARVSTEMLHAIAGKDAALRSARVKAALDDGWAELEAALAAFTYTAASPIMVQTGYQLGWAGLFAGGANDRARDAMKQAQLGASEARARLRKWQSGEVPLAGATRKAGTGAEALGEAPLLSSSTTTTSSTTSTAQA